MKPTILDKKPIFSILLIIIALVSTAFAGQIKGKVVGVSDGDTIIVVQGRQQFKIRLYGIDSPESGQAFGQKAKEFTSSVVFGKNVEVTVLDVDKYGRSVGVVRIEGTTVNEALLQNGFAWLYTKYCDQSFCGNWKTIEVQAATKSLGLWADKDPVSPWEWRRTQRGEWRPQTAVARNLPEEPSTGAFHGNTRSHVFHAPSCQHYNCKNCTETFRYSEEAERAGFRKHEQCVKG